MDLHNKTLLNRRYTRDVSETMDLTIVYEDGDDGWIVASIPAVPGVLSQGRTREEARENVLDALALMLSPEPVEAGDERERELLHLTVT
jgi:predicted RNase H-like HicB family nuclease